MADSPPPPVAPPAARPRAGQLPAIPARWGFWKGLLTGAAIEIPVIAGTVWVLHRLGIGGPDAGFMAVIRLTTMFAGVAALLTAGGVGRLAAHASAQGGRGRAVLVGARAHAVAGAGLVLLAMIPHGGLPGEPVGWLPIALAGLVPGALCGALIGAVCGGATPVGLGDVWDLARRPGEAVIRLLDPEDLIKLGAAVRARTTHLLDGIFDPAPPPPGPGAPPVDPAAPRATTAPPAAPTSPTPPADRARPE